MPPTTKPVILSFIGYYFPGFKAGGPIRTITNMVEQLGDEIDFRIITRDRDSSDQVPYPDVTVDDWNQVGQAQVFYASPDSQSLRNLGRLIRDTKHDLLYFNSVFDPVFSIKPMLLHKLGVIPQRPVLLAPRGEFSPGALDIKSVKKRLFICVSKVLRLYKGITWHASSEMEQKDIERYFPCRSNDHKTSHVKIALDLGPKYLPAQNKDSFTSKKPGTLRIVFLSRIAPKKNLDFALRVLKGVCGTVLFDIYGPVNHHSEYWKTCEQLISEMPNNITVQHKGIVEYNDVRSTFSKYHAFLFPTRGENFGHVILESLSAGCPVILSDQTPWQDLEERQSGWNIPLSQPEKFQLVLEQLVAMNENKWKIHSQQALQHAIQTTSNSDTFEQNRSLFFETSRNFSGCGD